MVSELPFQRVAILGLGLIGGSLAKALHQRGLEVVGQNVREASVLAAQADGIPATTSVAEAVVGADLVVLATPLWTMGEVAAQVAAAIGTTSDATVIDVGSVKAPVYAAIEAAGLADRFVGAHPMAGNERSGYGAATADLLVAAPWALTRTAETDPRRFAAVYELVHNQLAGRISVLDPDVHDRCVALISQFPHVLAVELLNVAARAADRDQALALAAGSFRDGTRVARTDPERTMAMVTENADQVAVLLRTAAADLLDLAQRLESGAGVADFFHAADDLRNGTAPAKP